MTTPSSPGADEHDDEPKETDPLLTMGESPWQVATEPDPEKVVVDVDQALRETPEQAELHMERRKRCGTARLIFLSDGYECSMACFILVNAVYIGVSIDYPELLSARADAVIHIVFVLLWSLETIVKAFVFGWDFWKSAWNIFDLTITCLACLEIGTEWGVMGGDAHDFWHRFFSGDFVQVLRLFRLLRLGHVFTQLGVLTEAFVQSLRALAFISLFGLIWFFIAACIFTVFVGRKHQMPSQGEEDIREVREVFNTVPESMLTLFEVMTLEGWPDYCRPLMGKNWVWALVFIVFIFVSAFFFLNLVTAVVVDKTLAAQDAADAREANKGTESHVRRIKILCKQLRYLNNDQDFVSREQLANWLKGESQDVAKIIKAIDWTPSYVMSMFMLCDHDHNGKVLLKRLEQLMINRDLSLTTQHYVQLEVNLARRVEYLEKINILAFKGFQQILADGKLSTAASGKIDLEQMFNTHVAKRHETHVGKKKKPPPKIPERDGGGVG